MSVDYLLNVYKSKDIQRQSRDIQKTIKRNPDLPHISVYKMEKS
jgi:hypothetical protein